MPTSPGSRSAAIADGAVVGRPHLARALAASGAVATPADAFTADWIADGGRAFVDRYAPDLARAVGLVLAAGGVPVLAHPRSPGYEIPDEVIAALAGAGLCGIEVFHFDHDQSQRLRLTQLAKSLNLIMTGGSDDHGTYPPGGRPVPPRAITAALAPRRRRRRSTSGCSPWPPPQGGLIPLTRPVRPCPGAGKARVCASGAIS